MSDPSSPSIPPGCYPHKPNRKAHVGILIFSVFAVAASWGIRQFAVERGDLFLHAVAILGALMGVLGFAKFIAIFFEKEVPVMELTETTIRLPLTLFGTRYRTLHKEEIAALAQTVVMGGGRQLWLSTPNRKSLLERRHVIDENHLSSTDAYLEVRQHIADMVGVPDDEIPTVSAREAASI